jgi:hypothetical protein
MRENEGDIPEYTSKAKTVRAIFLTPETADMVAAWTGGTKVETTDAVDSEKKYVGVNIPTLAGTIRAMENQVVCRIDGEWKLMSTAEFQAEYE